MLSQTILLTSEAVTADFGTASHAVSAPVSEATVPWYIKIFRTPNLALAMGALVLTFGGILGYLALQNRSNSPASTVAEVRDQELSKGGPTYSGAAAANTANTVATVANTAANTTNISTAPAPVMPSTTSNTISNPTAGDVGRSDLTPGTAARPETEKTATTGSASVDPAKPASIAPPPPVDQPVVSRDERKAGEDKHKDDADRKELAMSKTGIYDRSREEPQAAKKTGPNRASGGPRNNTQQQEMNTQNAAGMIAPPTTTVGGKTFEKRNGVWYDSAYHGQSTKTVKRGSDTYKKLDGGLRSIADSIGGTVVVVWTDKAYRIN